MMRSLQTNNAKGMGHLKNEQKTPTFLTNEIVNT